MPTTIAETLKRARPRLPESETPELDAAVLLCQALGRPRAYLYTWPERELTGEEAEGFEALLNRRAAGEPVAHILGEREFWSLSLRVTPQTLIPRPETELLVELALERIPANIEWEVADLGTGSGAVALAIARERPRCRITAVDRSTEALAVARENGLRHHIANVEFVHGDWFGTCEGRRFHLVASNPPYVADGDPHLTQGDARFDPREALASGADGLDDIRRIAAAAPAHLHPGGWLLLEHGYDQGERVRSLLTTAGLEEVKSIADLSGHPRITLGRRPA